VDLQLEDITPESWHIREVYACFGLALYMAQVLEHGIVNLARWTRIGEGTTTTFDESEADCASLFRQTMGTLKKSLLKRRSWRSCSTGPSTSATSSLTSTSVSVRWHSRRRRAGTR
jgi:hypothetical protein